MNNVPWFNKNVTIYINNVNSSHLISIFAVIIYWPIFFQAKSLTEQDKATEEMYNGIDNLEDHMSNLAGEFLVFKAVVSDPEINHSLVVAKMSCSSINPQRLSQVMNAIINGLAVYDVDVISLEVHENFYNLSRIAFRSRD